jgi:hypothetical protein
VEEGGRPTGFETSEKLSEIDLEAFVTYGSKRFLDALRFTNGNWTKVRAFLRIHE